MNSQKCLYLKNNVHELQIDYITIMHFSYNVKFVQIIHRLYW